MTAAETSAIRHTTSGTPTRRCPSAETSAMRYSTSGTPTHRCPAAIPRSASIATTSRGSVSRPSSSGIPGTGASVHASRITGSFAPSRSGAIVTVKARPLALEILRCLRSRVRPGPSALSPLLPSLGSFPVHVSVPSGKDVVSLLAGVGSGRWALLGLSWSGCTGGASRASQVFLSLRRRLAESLIGALPRPVRRILSGPGSILNRSSARCNLPRDLGGLVGVYGPVDVGLCMSAT